MLNELAIIPQYKQDESYDYVYDFRPVVCLYTIIGFVFIGGILIVGIIIFIIIR